MAQRQVRRICYTINNYTWQDICDATFMNLPGCEYVVIGFEVGGKEKTPHLQCYAEFKAKIDFNKVKKHIPRAHIEVAKGTTEQASVYCKKDGNFVEFGQPYCHQGRVTMERIEQVMDAPEQDPHLYNQYRRMYHDIKMIRNETKYPTTTVYITKQMPLVVFKALREGTHWKVIYIQKLTDLEYYVSRGIEFDTVIISDQVCKIDSHESIILLNEGQPLIYNYGYETRRLSAARLIVAGVYGTTYKTFTYHGVQTLEDFLDTAIGFETEQPDPRPQTDNKYIQEWDNENF